MGAGEAHYLKESWNFWKIFDFFAIWKHKLYVRIERLKTVSLQIIIYIATH